MFGVVGTASPAQASSTLWFRLRNVTTGQCLMYNGDGKAVTQAKCQVVKKQLWARAGQNIVTANDRIPGLTCLTSANGHEKPVTVIDCSKSDITHNGWTIRTTTLHQKTIVGGPSCGYLKVVSGKVICGKRMLDSDRDYWEIY
ncbi:hypothetical protein J2Z21_002129 [Streptomyces griseochromogenes]|uniref:Ricin B lectin domain-containing protein n=2 Tax=Streptomyces griseochromogenes TaxID=68214 RepID=A0ABS4LPB5_9ACTN|nr:hypothetical protein [Streptomyces griseochromogenes]